MLLAAGNRIGSLHGLSSMGMLECLDLKCNYVERLAEVRVLSLNAALRVLTLQGNPVAKQSNYRAAIACELPALLTLDAQAWLGLGLG